jgi:hypothetical protein
MGIHLSRSCGCFAIWPRRLLTSFRVAKEECLSEKHGHLVLSDEKDIPTVIPKGGVTYGLGNFVVSGESERNCVWVNAEHREAEAN